MSFWAYILRCADGSYYTGHAEDIERRLAEHQSGALPGYTHDRRPVELVWSESFPTREQALAAELRIEPWSRAKKEALIASDWAALGHAAIPPRERAARALASAAPRLRSGQTEEGSAIVPFAGPPEQSVPPAHRPPPTYHPVRPERSRGSVPREADAARNPEILPPAIILVRPQLGENIGKAARAMLNFGLTDLRLVAPRDGWPNPSAGPAASGADIVLERAQIFDDVAAASADCTHVYATTVRRRGLVKPVVTPAEAAARIRTEPGRAAILFGPERTGLETDDVAAARTILTVPINPEFGSLNLAQAVILVAYEWSKGESLASPPAIDLDPPAPQAELEGLVEHLQGLLDKAGYFFPPDRAPATRRTLRSVLTKASWNAQEVRTLRGVLSALEKPRQR